MADALKATTGRMRGVGLATQVGLLLMGALLASHFIAMLLLQRTAPLIHPISREQAIATLAAAHTLARHDPDYAMRSGLLALQQAQASGTASTRLWIAQAPEVPAFAMQPEERRLAADFIARAGLDKAPVAHWMQIERASGREARASLLSLAAWEPLQLRASVQISPTQWLNASLALQGRYDWSHILAYTLPASIIPVLIIALLLAWRLARPLRTLMEATAQVRYGKELPALPLRGPREARELTRQFNAMQQRIARHRDSRTRMLAAISHDLRTPVTALRLQAELIEPPDVRDELLASIAELKALVEETLDFARADARIEPAQRIDIAKLLRSLVRRYAQMGQSITMQSPAVLEWTCRPLALQRAVVNLIDNALQHAGGAALSASIQNDVLELRITDNGPGIPESELDAVFEPFLQLDEARGPQRHGSGLGLGLSIARTCIEMQGGSLDLRNQAEGGLCATIRCPRV